MKIALICRGRTNSTAIGHTLANQLNINWRNEIYFAESETFIKKMSLRPKLSNVLELYKQNLQKITDSLLSDNNFGIKIFPSTVYYPPYLIHENESFVSVKSKFIFDLKILHLQQYDHFYFLNRNLLDSAISWLYAHKTSAFHSFKLNKKKYIKINLGVDDFARAKFYIIEYLMQQKLLNYLNYYNLPVTVINEESAKHYINQDIVNTIKTPIQYQDYIHNLPELYDFINYWYPICEKETLDWNFY